MLIFILILVSGALRALVILKKHTLVSYEVILRDPTIKLTYTDCSLSCS